MTPLTNYNAAPPPRGGDSDPAPDPFSAWSAQKGYESALRLRLPALLASSRLRLGSRRCDQLQREIDELEDRLLNAPSLMPFEHRNDLEKRLSQAHHALHAERLTAWRDLLPLTRELRDAALEDLRSGFLSELTRIIGESTEDTYPR